MIYSTRGRQPKVYRLPPSCIALNGILLLSLCGGTLRCRGFSFAIYNQILVEKACRGVSPTARLFCFLSRICCGIMAIQPWQRISAVPGFYHKTKTAARISKRCTFLKCRAACLTFTYSARKSEILSLLAQIFAMNFLSEKYTFAE